MNDIMNTSNLAKEALVSNKRARCNDNYLYYLICEAKLAGSGININDVILVEGLLHRCDLGLPNFETVRRTRQKIHQSFPDLAGDAETEAIKAIREEEFKDYARKVMV